MPSESDDLTIHLSDHAQHLHTSIHDCKWKLKTFVERDAYVEYDYAAGYAHAPCDVIHDFHISAINKVMMARSSRKAWANFTAQLLPELATISPELDLIDSAHQDVEASNIALQQLTRRMSSVPGLTEMAVSKVLHLLRPRFIAIADEYVRNCLGLYRRPAGEMIVAVQNAVRDLGHRNANVLNEQYLFANSLPQVERCQGRFAGQSFPVKLTKARILDILMWTDVAIHGSTPHTRWNSWYTSEILGVSAEELVERNPATASLRARISTQRRVSMGELDVPEKIAFFSGQPSDGEYQAWLTKHPMGYVVACDKIPWARSKMKLHKAGCIWISDPAKGPFTTRDYAKACSATRRTLFEWCQDDVEGDFSECKVCKP